MEVDAILCDHAPDRRWQALHLRRRAHALLGGSATSIYGRARDRRGDPGAVTATGQAHTFTVALFDEDGHPVVPFGAEDTAEVGGVEASVPFELGRP